MCKITFVLFLVMCLLRVVGCKLLSCVVCFLLLFVVLVVGCSLRCVGSLLFDYCCSLLLVVGC